MENLTIIGTCGECAATILNACEDTEQGRFLDDFTNRRPGLWVLADNTTQARQADLDWREFGDDCTCEMCLSEFTNEPPTWLGQFSDEDSEVRA